MTVQDDPVYRDLLEQFRGSVDANSKVYERVTDLRVRLLAYVERGEGLTQEELVQIYARLDAVFPRRVRKPATPEQEEKVRKILDEVRAL